MSTSTISRVTRRRFLKETGLTLAAAGSAPLISAPFVSRALADTKTLSIVQWSHFVPAYDKWFDKFAKDWGEKNKIAVTVDHIPVQDVAARAAAEASAGSGHDLFGWNGAGGAHLYRKFLIDVGDLVKSVEKKYGKVSTIGRQLGYNQDDGTWSAFPDYLHQFPGHVPQEHVGRDRDEARHVGQSADRRRQAESERQPGRDFARSQQRSEHDVARPVVELWRRRPGRGRQESRAQQQGDGRSGQVRRRSLQGSDDVGRPFVERLQQQPVHRFRGWVRTSSTRSRRIGRPRSSTKKWPTTFSS